MTNTTSRTDRHDHAVVVPLLWIMFGLAWLTLVGVYQKSGNGPGTMGLAFPQFLALWSVMVVAMMTPCLLIPAIKPAIRMRFALGYFVPWIIVGTPIYVVALAADRVVSASTATATASAGVLLLGVALYQSVTTKRICLEQAQPSSFPHSVRTGLATGIACVGCSAPLMASTLLVFGMMNLGVMVVVAVLMRLERTSPIGRRVIGVTASLAMITVLVAPSIAAGLHAAQMTAM